MDTIPHLPLDVVGTRLLFASVLVTSLSYGLYLGMSITSTYLLVKHGAAYEARNWTLVYIVVMSILATINYISNVIFWTTVFAGVDRFSASCFTLQLLVAGTSMLEYLASDLVLLFRTWKAWDQRKTIIVFPAIMYLSSGVIGLGSAVVQFADFILVVFFVFTVLFNAYTTVAIAYRAYPLLCHGRDARMIQARSGSSIILLLENGALYTFVGIAFLALEICEYVANSFNDRVIASDAVFRLVWQVMPLLGPATVILRISLGLNFSTPPKEHVTPLTQPEN